jgi:hypothetical protein
MTKGKYKRINRTYTLDDGRIVTIKELKDLTGIPQSKLYYRLTKSRDIKYLSQSIDAFKTRHRSAFKEIYKDTPPKIMKLLFGKW